MRIAVIPKPLRYIVTEAYIFAKRWEGPPPATILLCFKNAAWRLHVSPAVFTSYLAAALENTPDFQCNHYYTMGPLACVSKIMPNWYNLQAVFGQLQSRKITYHANVRLDISYSPVSMYVRSSTSRLSRPKGPVYHYHTSRQTLYSSVPKWPTDQCMCDLY